MENLDFPDYSRHTTHDFPGPPERRPVEVDPVAIPERQDGPGATIAVQPPQGLPRVTHGFPEPPGAPERPLSPEGPEVSLPGRPHHPGLPEAAASPGVPMFGEDPVFAMPRRIEHEMPEISPPRRMEHKGVTSESPILYRTLQDGDSGPLSRPDGVIRP